MMALLIEAKARVNAKDSEGNTPLHYACEEGHGDCAVYLIQHRGNLDQLNSQGKSPLDLCTNHQVRSFIQSQIQEEDLSS
ncbi:ankyrin repeat-containing domain protein [Mycotypha africana]|uniref:ankyrin repeat-containing domain protein n=1 Tax=Mycotypha africana TaxID=64632 RepID=UPI0023006F74|nr:ankyrin repeat-containing domain protein [Mycotypha africana]KAI8984656.1 ankyrin repeat-containing domain protein [Mycotypha africana]